IARRLQCLAGPETDRLGVECGGHIHGAAQEIEPNRPLRGIGAEQRRLMLAPWIEQKTRAGFDDDAEMEFAESIAKEGKQASRVGIVRIERVIVQRQGDAAIAEVRQDSQGVVEPMMGETIGVVAETHPRPRDVLTERNKPPRTPKKHKENENAY